MSYMHLKIAKIPVSECHCGFPGAIYWDFFSMYGSTWARQTIFDLSWMSLNSTVQELFRAKYAEKARFGKITVSPKRLFSDFLVRNAWDPIDSHPWKFHWNPFSGLAAYRLLTPPTFWRTFSFPPHPSLPTSAHFATLGGQNKHQN